MNHELVNRFDPWLVPHSPVAAVVARQYLMPVEGKDAVIFPPTYLRPNEYRGEWPGYNIDHFPDGSSVCLVDSVGSQANRLEPLFKEPPYAALVPQVQVRLASREEGEVVVHLLDAGHRAADAVVRFSDLAGQLRAAFAAFAEGDALPLARLAPTSIVFGAWDSRGTQVKIPRLVRATIRAFNLRLLHRSAVYIPPVNYEERGMVEEVEPGRRSEEGLVHNPATWSHGGVQVLGEIRRDCLLNLTALRAVRAQGDADSLPLRRYLLGLALVVFTAPPEVNLREGCELVPDPDHPARWELVLRDGTRQEVALPHQEMLAFAQAAAVAFQVPSDPIYAQFNAAQLSEALKKSKKERKKSAEA